MKSQGSLDASSHWAIALNVAGCIEWCSRVCGGSTADSNICLESGLIDALHVRVTASFMIRIVGGSPQNRMPKKKKKEVLLDSKLKPAGPLTPGERWPLKID